MMKTLLLLLSACSLAFSQNTIFEQKLVTPDFAESLNRIATESPALAENSAAIVFHRDLENQMISSTQNMEKPTDTLKQTAVDNELSVTYETKKMKKASVYSKNGKLLQTSSKNLLDEKKLKAGEYVIKVDFQDGTSTSAKYIKE